MIATLPPHVAMDDEPVPDLGGRPWDGPDIREATPIDAMIGQLRALPDDAEWVAHWLLYAAEAGCSIMVEQDGHDTYLRYGTPCDAQIRHRSRWMHFLLKEMDSRVGARDLLMRYLTANGRSFQIRRREAARA